MEAVLYHPEYGYYSRSGDRIGQRGDFYTSGDLDPLFGKLLARKFAEMALQLGSSFTLVELGAGKGTVARDILTHRRFPYLILERSPAMRRHQQKLLQEFDVEWIDALPSDLQGCVFSNEFLDALPVRRFVRRDGRLKEIFVGEGFCEIEGEPEVQIDLPIAEGQSADVCLEAPDWIRRIAASLKRGYHLAIDYGYLRNEFFNWPRGTLMCYWQHQAVEDPYTRIGCQDITAHVNFSDLIDAGKEAGLELVGYSNQMNFLVGLGLLDEMRELTQKADAESIRRMLALKKLLLPGSMGERFKVLVQKKVEADLES